MSEEELHVKPIDRQSSLEGFGAARRSSPISSGIKLRGSQAVIIGLYGDNVREKTKRLKEEKQQRQAFIDSRHEYLFDIIALLLDLTPAMVADQVLDEPKCIELAGAFFEKGMAKSTLFFYQLEYPPSAEIRKDMKASQTLRVLPTTGKYIKLTGRCISFISLRNDEITPEVASQEILYNIMDSADNHPNVVVLSALSQYYDRLFFPLLVANNNWGPMYSTPDGKTSRQYFLEYFRSFIDYLNDDTRNIKGRVKLKESDEFDLSTIITPEDIHSLTEHPEKVAVIESLIRAWNRQVIQVISESRQIRSESDEVGPVAELQYWRSILAKFSSLNEQIRYRDCQTVIQILTASHSKALKLWNETSSRFTDQYNEAKNNVKYLYPLQRFCEPLYSNDLNVVRKAIPSLISVVRRIHSVSRFYNTSDHMTSLFVKVTNQMVMACKKYIRTEANLTVWQQPEEEIRAKMNECMALYKYYQNCFHKIKKEAFETPGCRPFQFSEIYTFGRFQAFCKRLTKIMELMDNIRNHDHLTKTSIEVLQGVVKRYKFLCKDIKEKKYDFLDHRNKEIDNDINEFENEIEKLKEEITQLLEDNFDVISTRQALKLIKRYEALMIPNMDYSNKYLYLLKYFGEEIEQYRQDYTQQCKSPPLDIYMPPYAGRVTWALAILSRIQYPMEQLKVYLGLLKVRDARRIVDMYNDLALVLTQYTMIIHDGWKKQVPTSLNGLNAPILVCHPDTKVLYPNLDQYILQTIRETNCFCALEMEIPAKAQLLAWNQRELKSNYSQLKSYLAEYDILKAKIPDSIKQLMEPVIQTVYRELKVGTTRLTWASRLITPYFKNVRWALDYAHNVLKEVVDMMYKIEKGLEDMSNVVLVDIPEEEVLSIEKFLERTQAKCEKCVVELNRKSKANETALQDLINVFIKEAKIYEEETNKREKYIMSLWTKFSSKSEEMPVRRQSDDKHAVLMEQCDELRQSYGGKVLEALIRCIRHSLHLVCKRIMSKGAYSVTGKHQTKEDKDVVKPLFKSTIKLFPPKVEIEPSLDEIQQTITKCTETILDVSKHVKPWETGAAPRGKHIQKLDASGAQRVAGGDYFYAACENSENFKIITVLNSFSTSIQGEIQTVLDNYKKYQSLWMDDKEQCANDFMETDPLVNDIKAMMRHYEELQETFNNLTPYHNAGAIRLGTDHIKKSLLAEAAAWQTTYGNYCRTKYRGKLQSVVDFITNRAKELSRPINDLDDIRAAMTCLEKINENQIEFENLISPIEEVYEMLQNYQIDVRKEDTERVDTLKFNFEKVINQAKAIQNSLNEIQDSFKTTLVESVEEFTSEVLNYEKNYTEKGPMAPDIHPKEARDRVLSFKSKFDDLWRKYETYSEGEVLFGANATEYPELLRIRKELQLLQKLYGLYSEVMESIDGYSHIIWSELDIDKINEELQDFQNRCRKLPKALKDWRAFLDLKQKIDDFNEKCPILEHMSNKAMCRRHWLNLSEVIGYEFEIDSDTFSLKDVIDAPLLEYRDDVEEICISAVKEEEIEAKLQQIVADWSTISFSFKEFKNRGELLLKGQETADIMSLLEDSLLVLTSLSNNRYNQPFKHQIRTLNDQLASSSDIIERWLTVQNLWSHLESVFIGGDIAKQLPKEAKRFQKVDKSWIRVMSKAHETPNVVECCTGDDVVSNLLPHLLEQLELCQKSLEGYLESKRLIFPRFFFVSNTVLLEILGEASDSHSIQSHLLGIFENVASVKFSEKEYDRILSVISKEEEEIELEKHVIAKGNVELWLGDLLMEQRHSLNEIITKAYRDISRPEFDLIALLYKYICQVAILVIQIIWTRESEEALYRANTRKKIMASTANKFNDILRKLIKQTTIDLSEYLRVKFETLITIHVHQKDIFDDLVSMNVRSPLDFQWVKQSRFYFKYDEKECNVRITDVNFIYQNEFLGCTERLVITPLTDRCYISLAQVILMSMGGAPTGPAGTGKTETTKDMGKALGKYVVVFNCSDQMDFRGLGRIFKGLAQSGTWGCFDEFNRIELPVLSVAAQQINIVLTARYQRKKEFKFHDGDSVKLDPEFGIFITMNPGYAGRQELPENLKVLFRTVAMMVPDRQIIIRVKLASCGFEDNSTLAVKFFTLYKLCEEQLTKQVHYDFGLRNILSVLRTLGAAKRARRGENERSIVMSVMRDMNLSKLIDEDEPLFLSLINDLFPDSVIKVRTYEKLQNVIGREVAQEGLINHPPWNLKLIQLFETQLVRHGIMTLGPSGAGKSCCIHILMRAMTVLEAPHREIRMNPKAITASQMFGRLDVVTNDWTDGIFSAIWRKTLKAKKGEHVWLVLDGPVDSLWIENLNSVLDDNKTLTLANGDRIPMSPRCKIIFEPHNVDNASPATVSRNGMVYISSSALDWKPILQAWMNKHPQEQPILNPLFEKVYEDLWKFLTVNVFPKMMLLQCNYIKQAIDLMDGLIVTEHGVTISQIHLERIFVFAIMWSLGALLELDDRRKFEEYIWKYKKSLALPPVSKDRAETMFEFVINAKGEWRHLSKFVEKYIYPPDEVPPFSSILVPNVDNVGINSLIHIIAEQKKAVLLIGEQGTAKTVMINGYVRKKDHETHVCKTFAFSSATTPMMFQRNLESCLDKRMGTNYGPPSGKTMTIFIDDINMPSINEWGDQVTNEIVRQTMEQHGFYNLDKPGEFTHISDIQFIAGMNHPGGGRNDIPQRLKRHFSIFNCTLPSDNSIDQIFGTIAKGYFCSTRFCDEICSRIPAYVVATRILWQKTKNKMLPTPAKFHYVFNLRDLSRIWEGMLHIENAECKTRQTLIALWKHECTRVIADRFINEADRTWFAHTVKAVADEFVGGKTTPMPDEPYFVDFMRDIAENIEEIEEEEEEGFELPKVYEQVHTIKEIKDRLQFYMEQHNDIVRSGRMDLVFFKDAVVHLVKISRIIRTPRANALLVGVGGSGKQSLTHLASFIACYKAFQITLTRTYNSGNLIDDLKLLYRIAGVDGKGVSFIFTDNDIKEECFLEYLNNALTTGEALNMYAKDEVDEIAQSLVPAMKKECPKVPPSMENLLEYFAKRARDNFHVVLSFSPIGDKFRNRALKFPGLISGCTIDWFTRWPKDALIAVSSHFIQPFRIECSQETKDQIIDLMGVFHDHVAETCEIYFQRFRRQTYVTPKSYLSFIDGYKTIYDEKLAEIDSLSQRINSGLHKLVEAADSVGILKDELAIKQAELVIATEKTNQVLKEVTDAAAAAKKAKDSVQKMKEKAESLVGVIERDRALASDQLEEAKPALEAAREALKKINPLDIATVRKLGKPPHLIMRIMDCVLILLQRPLDKMQTDPEKPCPKPSWGESLKLMNNTQFLNMLLNFKEDTINAEIVELMVPYTGMEDYNDFNARKVCGNVAGLCQWTTSMSDFFEVNKKVLPLKANLALQEAKLAEAVATMETSQIKLIAMEKEFDRVQEEYNRAVIEKQLIVDDATRCQEKMETAEALIAGLQTEWKRWTLGSQEFKSQITRLVGDALLCAGFLSYVGPFNQEYRNIIMKYLQKQCTKRKINFTQNLNLITTLSEQATIAEWHLQGLPNDDLSTQNGIIATKAARFPLLIDPQAQAIAWIKNKEKNNDLTVTSLNQRTFRDKLEKALFAGAPLIIEDVQEELDPVLDNILDKNYIKTGRTFKVKVGDKEIDVIDGFRLYITTKLPNPSFSPEINARTSIIDFTVTIKGLEDQLLGRVILIERQELEKERTELLESIAANKRKMQTLEDSLLDKLASTKGSLIEDESLMRVLTTTKDTAADVLAKLTNAAETEIMINKAREEFRLVATRGSILYFLICDMSMVNVMYQTSLAQFLELFDRSMHLSEKALSLNTRLKNIIDYLTYEVFRYTSRGLYEVHKNLFVLLLALKIDMERGKVSRDEFKIFIRGGAALDLKAVTPKPKEWISDMTWLNLVALSDLQNFREILTKVQHNDKRWKIWYEKSAPEEEDFPENYSSSLDAFKSLLLIRCWCPDRVFAQARKYISESLSPRYAEQIPLNIEAIWKESKPLSPLIGLLSIGYDPTNLIEHLAKKLTIELQAISMGQGQDVHARKMLDHTMTYGGWAFLQNCHLGLDFMDELYETLMTKQNIHETFRLWITTEVHPKFPITLLQVSIKFTSEPPQGMKTGLKGTFSGISQDKLEIIPYPQWQPLLYTVSFLHSVVQERRKFGPLGWNIPYEFNTSDWFASVQAIQNHLDDMDPRRGLSWPTIHYMLGEIQYGGKVTDDYDKRLLVTLLKTWFKEEMFLDNFCFHTGHGYKIPKCTTVEQYIKFIEQIPPVDSPLVFGLHPNADITCQSNGARDMLDIIQSIQPKDVGSGGGETRESVVYKIATDMLEKLPEDYVPHLVKARLQKMGPTQSMNIFLRQEIDRMQIVITIVRNTLADLHLAIDGTIIMNEDLRNALDRIYDARVPKLWHKVSWESTTLGFWFTEMLERNQQYSNWIFVGRPDAFWMGGFFNPQGFLTAMRQEVSRKHNWALDMVILDNLVLKQHKEDINGPPNEGVYVHSLFLEGASWDRKNFHLVESLPKQLFALMPVIHILAINVEMKDTNRYECPVYKRPCRTDLTFITALLLKSAVDPNHWILRGVALLCDVK